VSGVITKCISSITLCIVAVVTSHDGTLLTDRGPAATVRPARVFLLIGQLGLGGAEKQVVLLARGLRARGVDTTVLVMFAGGPREDALRAAGVPVVHLGFRRRTAGWGMLPSALMAFFRLVGHLRRMRPDVLHAFLIHSYVVAAPAARLAGVPVLVAGRRSLGDFKQGRRLVLALERAATRATDHLIANAEAVAADARRQEGFAQDKITVVYNGLPDSAFDPAPPAVLATDLPVVLCVANFRPYKGHWYLLDAIARLRAEGLPCTLVLVGDVGGELLDERRLAGPRIAGDHEQPALSGGGSGEGQLQAL
jgi:glycosyltransferase involved in cell wall biosynthesis